MSATRRMHRDVPDEATIEWHMTQCQCGEITLEFGAVSVRMTPRDLARLHRLIDAAMVRFQIEPSAEEVGHEPDVVLH